MPSVELALRTHIRFRSRLATTFQTGELNKPISGYTFFAPHQKKPFRLWLSDQALPEFRYVVRFFAGYYVFDLILHMAEIKTCTFLEVGAINVDESQVLLFGAMMSQGNAREVYSVAKKTDGPHHEFSPHMDNLFDYVDSLERPQDMSDEDYMYYVLFHACSHIKAM